MERKEIERLREICEKEGFEFSIVSFSDCNDKKALFDIKKKDEWEGVEFAKCIFNHDPIKKDIIVKINRIAQANHDGHFHIFFNTSEGEKYSHVNNFKPSTEQAYKSQLIQEVYERFGEIKTNTKFDVSCFNGFKKTDFIYIPSSNIDWEYDKANDILYLQGFRLYQKGKWATKIEKPEIKVEYTGWEYQPRFDNSVNIGFKVPNDFVMSVRLGELMAEFIKNHIENEKTS